MSELVCRKACFPCGLCVTIEPIRYVFAGGCEDGVRIGMIQYPPFPEATAVLEKKAIVLGQSVAEANCQWSYSIITPNECRFFSRRNK